jgi:hypothetical protein
MHSSRARDARGVAEALGSARAAPTPKAVRPERLLWTRGPVASPPLRLAARAAIVVDAGTGRVLSARRPHRRLPVASTTKILTALLALRVLPRNALVTVPPAATRGPLVKEGLRPRERVRAWKLFYGLLLFSGNDDAAALALATAGSRSAFVARMNAEAQALGLRDSHFSTPSGVIDQDNYSSAWDLRGADARRAPRRPLPRDRPEADRAHPVVGADLREGLREQETRSSGPTPARDGVKDRLDDARRPLSRRLRDPRRPHGDRRRAARRQCAGGRAAAPEPRLPHAGIGSRTAPGGRANQSGSTSRKEPQCVSSRRSSTRRSTTSSASP